MEQEKTFHKTGKTSSSYARENELLEHVWQRVVQEDDPLDALLASKTQQSPKPDRQKPAKSRQKEPDDLDKLLQAHIISELDDMRMYQWLSQVYTRKAQVFSRLANEELRHAKRLCAAYFLRTGIRFWPSRTIPNGKLPDYWGLLRARFLAEQSQMESYKALSKRVQEEDLAALYQELAEAEKEHAHAIRRLLEAAI